MQLQVDAAGLLTWFREYGRLYPWAIHPTPYKVWISEVMLQQTVVSTVIPYYRKWMQSFPSIKKLAAACEEEVLHAWEGLGYYSRARNIHKTAGIITCDYKGRIPADYDTLCRLPGIGAYTAGAILSIAYNQPRPVLDANIMRIMQRLLAVRAADSGDRKRFYSLLAGMIPQVEPGSFNQALMQLGQLVCRKTQPLCNACPLKKQCRACRQGLQETIPARTKRTTLLLQSRVVIAGCGSACYVILQEKGRFRGLWLFPRWEEQQMPREINALLGNACRSYPLNEYTHSYTHYKEHLIPTLYLFAGKPHFLQLKGSWLQAARLSSLPFPSVYRKIVQEVQAILIPGNRQTGV